MKVYNTSQLDERAMSKLDDNEASWIYNGLDCCVAFEIFEILEEELRSSPKNVQQTYADSMAKQAPVLEMQMRGIRIDFQARDETVKKLRGELHLYNDRFQRIVKEAFGYAHLNWKSPLQVKGLFYDTLNLPEIKKRNSNGIFAATTDEDALNKLCLNFWAEPLAKYILAMREISKKLELLETEIDPDGRIRTSLSVAGTNTGRLASSASAFGSGRNLQNIDTTLRYPFVADPGFILVNVDLEQADARNVGAIIWSLFVDEYGPEEAGKYLDACESGDLHTQVTKMVWPELPWDEVDNPRSIADQIAYRAMSYRDLSKRLGHGTNYLGTPRTMAKHLHVETGLIQDFQDRYFSQFSLIPKWHQYVISEIKQFGCLTTPFGRRRFFFGRGNDASTHREAVAYSPQSMTGHEMDMGYLNLFRNMPEAQLLIQVHDSILFQVPYDQHGELIPKALELLRFQHMLPGNRLFEVPLEAQLGWNWGKQKKWTKDDFEKGKCKREQIGTVKSNHFGLRDWTGEPLRDLPPPTKKALDYFR